MNRKSRAGQAMIEFALIFPLLIGMLSLFVDVGFAQWRHLVTQNIAQGAAMSSAVSAMQAGTFAASSASCPTATAYLTVGCQYAAVGASTAFHTATTLTAGLGAPSGVVNPNTEYFVTASVHELILPIFGTGLNINAVSTACVWQSGSQTGVFLVQ